MSPETFDAENTRQETRMLLDAQMQYFIECLLKKFYEREAIYLYPLEDNPEELNQEVTESDVPATLPYQLEYYTDDINLKRIHFWFCMANIVLSEGINYPSDEHCDLRAWFKEMILPIIVQEFGCSCREERAQLMSRLAVRFNAIAANHLPTDIMSSIHSFSPDQSIRRRVEERVIERAMVHEDGVGLHWTR